MLSGASSQHDGLAETPLDGLPGVAALESVHAANFCFNLWPTSSSQPDVRESGRANAALRIEHCGSVRQDQAV